MLREFRKNTKTHAVRDLHWECQVLWEFLLIKQQMTNSHHLIKRIPCVWGIAFLNRFDHFFPSRDRPRPISSCVFYYHLFSETDRWERNANNKKKTIWNMKSFQLFDFDWKLLRGRFKIGSIGQQWDDRQWSINETHSTSDRSQSTIL